MSDPAAPSMDPSVADTGRRTSVLVVDDSAFMRKLIAEMIESAPDLHVAGFARNGVDALRQIAALDPNVMTLDLEMPQLDGMQVLAQVMASAPRPVIVLSAGGAQFGDATIRALELGAVDFVKKPSGPISLDLPRIRDRLIAAVRAASAVDLATLCRVPLVSPVVEEPGRMMADTVPHTIVVIAASTGGPRALAEILPALPARLDAAVLIAQHMPKEFTTSFAMRLDRASAMRVHEGRDGEPIHAGHVYIAPGGMHMRSGGSRTAPVLCIEAKSARTVVAPSADLLFMSAAELFGAAVVAVVLTGMGRDGSEGIRAVCAARGQSLLQDRATSVIYGMPQAALHVAGTKVTVPLHAMASAIVAAVESQAAAPRLLS